MTRRLKLPEVAERLTTTLRTVRGWIASGELRAINVSMTPNSRKPRYVVSETDLEAFEAARTTGEVRPQRKARQQQYVPKYFKRA